MNARGHSILTVISFAVIGQIIYVITQLGILSSLTHLRGAEAAGMFGLALAVTTPVFLLVNCGMRTAVAADAEQRFAFSEYTGLRFYSSLAGVLVSVAIGALLADSWIVFATIIVIALTKSVEAFNDVCYGIFDQKQRTDFVARSLVMRGLITLPIFFAFLLMGLPTPAAFCAQLVVWLSVLLLFDYPRASGMSGIAMVRPAIAKDRAWALLKRAAPLGGSSFSMAVQTSLPRLIVHHYLGLAALGVFTSVAYFQQAGGLVATAARYSLTARFAKLLSGGQDQETRQLARNMILAALAVCSLGLLIAYFFGSELLHILFGKTFSAYDDLLVLVAIALTFRMVSTVPVSLYLARGMNSRTFFIEAALVLVAGGAGLVMIQNWGLVGAGYALVTVAVTRCLIIGLDGGLGRGKE